MRKVTLLIGLLLLLLGNNAFATTATFQNGTASYTGSRDAHFYSFTDNESVTSTSTYIFKSTGDGYFYVLYFDISSIPTSATVTSATIQIELSEQNCATPTVGVKKIQDPNSSGPFTFPASAGDNFNSYATYHYKKHETTTKWDTSGGSSNFADVQGNSNEATFVMPACGAYVAQTFTITTMVQSWVTTPAQNAGMLFNTTTSGAVRLHGDYYSTTASRPLLTVNYTTSSGSKKLMTLDGE